MSANVPELSVERDNNVTDILRDRTLEFTEFSLLYRLLATAVHVTIFFLGVTGNALLIGVVFRTKCLQTPTYRYLVSLSFADLLVLLSAVPEAIVFHQIGRRWMADQASCSLFIFINFLGINAGSISILGFSIEIYVAICRPLISKRFCTTKRTNRIIAALWIFAVCYCVPWLGLTELKVDRFGRPQCDFRLSKGQYSYYFTADLFLFYATPLVVALVVYSKIVTVLRKSVVTYKRESYRKRVKHMPSFSGEGQEELVEMTDCMAARDVDGKTTKEILTLAVEACEMRKTPDALNGQDAEQRMRGRTHVLRMLIVIVCLFAVSWLPYRGLLVVNTFLEKPWLNLWYLFFAKTFIYLNSAMNPFLYSAMSRRFRKALYATLACKEPYDDHCETLDGVSDFSLNRTNQNLVTRASGNSSMGASQNGSCHRLDQTYSHAETVGL